MQEVTPDLQLRTLLVLDEWGRIVATREPEPARNPGPLFILIRSASSCAWAVRADVSAHAAAELDRLARDEPRIQDARDLPLHAERYLSFCGGQVNSGPAFAFPEKIAQPHGVKVVTEFNLLERNFRDGLRPRFPNVRQYSR